MAAEFQGQFNEAMREAELDEVKRQIQGVNDSVALPQQPDFNPIQTIRDELKGAIEAPVKRRVEPRPSRHRCRGRSRRAGRAADAPPADVPPADPTHRSGGCAEPPPAPPIAEIPSAKPSPRPETPSPSQDGPARVQRRPGRSPRSRIGREGRMTTERRGRDRGVAGAADRAPDRAALAADQGARRLRGDVLRLLRAARSTSTTSWSGPTCSPSARPRTRTSSTPTGSNTCSRRSRSRPSAPASSPSR